MKQVLILFPSWEERTHLGFKNYIAKYHFDKIYILEKLNSINPNETAESLKLIRNICKAENLEIENICLIDESKNTFNLLKSFVEKLEIDSKIFLDITTMSRNIIWSLFFFLKQKHKTINIIYCTPSEYSDEWISRDPSKPKLLFKHSGIIDLDLKNCLIIVTGFDTDRTKQLVKYFEPNKIVLLVQKENDFKNNKRNNPTLHRNICEELGYANVDTLYVDSYSQDLDLEIIENTIYQNLKTHNIILSSLGPKMSSISIYNAYIRHPEVALAYIPCKEYNVNYCKGLGEVIEYCLEFPD